MHQAERQCAVGSRQQRDVLVALVGGHRAAGIDGDQARAAPLRFLRQAPEVQVGDDAVATPEDDQPRIDDVLGVEADAGADRRPVAHRAGAGADRPVELGGAETVEEAAVHRPVAEQARVAGVAVGNDRVGAVGCADLAEALGDRRQRRVPGDALEARAGPLGADPAQGVEQPVGVVDALGVVGDLGAQHAGRRRVIGRAGDLDDAPVGDASRRVRRCPGNRAGRHRARPW
jgi:hypothetical protein